MQTIAEICRDIQNQSYVPLNFHEVSYFDNLLGKFISDIVLQILSFVAENERDNIKQRQAEGIKIAKEKGIHMGRPRYVKPDNFDDIVAQFKGRQISLGKAISALELSKSTLYKYL